MKKNCFYFMTHCFPHGKLRQLLLPLKLTVILCILTSFSAFAQQKVTGTVRDAKTSEPVIGVNVSVEGTTVGAITDVQGNFSIASPSSGATLVFSFVGYTTEKVQFQGQRTIDVKLNPETLALEEVVVVGYGTQKKKDITSSIAVVDVKDISRAPVASVTTALQGQTPGVDVQGNQARPGDLPTIRIRGVGSINNTDPLWVVDGVPAADISSLNPADIASMQVLKDAASAAIYGSRGANGVVIVTTKSGKTGAPKVSYKGYYGMEKAWKTLEVLNMKQWADMVYEGNTAGGSTPPPLALQIRNAPNGPWADWDGVATDWQGALFQTGAIYDNSFDISGGTANGNYYFSADQYQQDGIIIATPYKRYTVRMNSNWQTNKFKFGENITFNYSKQRVEGNGAGRDVLQEVIKITPNIPVYNPTALGGYSGYNTTAVGHDASNVIGSLERQLNYNYNKAFMANVFGEYQIFKDLVFRSTFGVNSIEFQNRNLTLKTDMQPKNFANTTLSESGRWSYNWVSENMFTYHKIMGDNDLTVMADYTSEYNKTHNMSAGGTTIQTDINDVLSMFEGGKTIGGDESETSRISYLGRLLYSYKGKYMVTANFRRDGSSKFGPGLKWGNFPSASLAWRVSEESFMKGISALNNLKIRGSFGLVGNDAPIGAYSYISGLGAGLDYVFNGSKNPGVAVNGFNNSKLTWEKSAQFDAGVDIGLFKGVLDATIDYFNKKTTDMLIGVPLPPSSGSSGTITQNLGSVLNSGFEFSATLHKNLGGVDVSLSGNFTTLHNEVLDMGGYPIASGGMEFGSATYTTKGYPIGEFYGYKDLGVFPTQAAADAYVKDGVKIQPNAKGGDIKFADLNNNGVIDAGDRYYMGSPIPKLTYGVTANLAYKGFDMSLFLQGVSGNKIFAAMIDWTQGMQNNFNAGVDALRRWQKDGDITDVPRAVRNDPNHNLQISDRYLRNGAYARLRNVSLGYTIPKSVDEWLKISNIRVYVTGRNLLTFTKYEMFDPEIGSNGGQVNLNRGIDNGYYPQARTMIMGIQIDF
jgi:TonB-linked SusC/RagA family outer membrane protein